MAWVPGDRKLPRVDMEGTERYSTLTSPSPETVVTLAETSDLENAAFRGLSWGDRTSHLALGLTPPGTLTAWNSIP